MRQLRVLGYSRDTASKLTRSGRLHRVHRGVYAVGHRRLDWHGQCLAAVLAAWPAVASHLSAAWLWGLLRYRPQSIHLIAPARRRARRPFVVHFADLAAEDQAEREEIPVTALPRTLVDLATVLPSPRLERCIERADELGHFDLRQVEELLARSSRQPGSVALREALAIYRDEPAFTRSGLERRFLELVRAAGLPAPSMNFSVGGYEIDAYWRTERFAVELDVYATHGGRAAFERDRLRQEDLKLIGVEMTRITGPRLDREPRQTIERVAALLAQRRCELA